MVGREHPPRFRPQCNRAGQLPRLEAPEPRLRKPLGLGDGRAVLSDGTHVDEFANRFATSEMLTMLGVRPIAAASKCPGRHTFRA